MLVYDHESQYIRLFEEMKEFFGQDLSDAGAFHFSALKSGDFTFY